MASWKNSVAIAAPADRVFAYVDDPMNLPIWLPTMVEVRDVIGTGAGQQFEWTSRMAGSLLRGQSTVIEHVPNVHGLHQSIGMVNSTFGYTVEPHEDGAILTVEIQYLVPVPVLGKLAERVLLRRNAREFEVGIVTIKDVLED
jgi:uncharacterized membrane protein